MGSINLNNLKNVNVNINNYTYVDLFLDIQEEPIGISGNFLEVPGSGRDIKVAYDLNAIRNSLTNLFNTLPGERFLQPEYGSDLRRYIFDPISEIQGNLIGREIYSSITRWEPRVGVISIDVLGIRETNEYRITLVLQIPFLKTRVNVKGIFTRQGFVFA